MMVLSRKLIENLVIDILRQKYQLNQDPKNLEIFYNKNKGQFHNFSLLLKNLNQRKNDFYPDQGIINEFMKLMGKFKPNANANAHSITIKSGKDEILEYNVPRIIALLYRLLDHL